LSTYNISKIDLLIATHPHEDHIGGLISVMKSTIPIQDIVYNGVNETTQVFSTWKTLALAHNLTQGSRNNVYALDPTINLTVASQTGPIQFGSDINANSMVLKLQVGNTSILLTGDATNEAEASMLASAFNLQSQVLKVGHHGSSYSTSVAFLNAVNPTYAVISAGLNNQYGHPTQQTLNRLSSNNITTYVTYKDGSIILQMNSANPTPSQSPIPSLSPTATSTPNATPSPTPVIPEFPSTIILALIVVSAMGRSITV
jgi:competence protein ComEC